MLLKDFTKRELEILQRGLHLLAVDESIIPDWEFSILMGDSRADFAAMLDRWSPTDGDTSLIQNGLNNLLGYPHDHRKAWDAYFGFSRSELVAVFDKRRGVASGYG
jgi:hypothetical protein